MVIDMTIYEAIKELKNFSYLTNSEELQIAEWLEELKVYQQHKIICNKGYNAGYNKAIDDFVEYVWETTSSSDIEWITRDYELYDLLQKKAEQLKAGGKE